MTSQRRRRSKHTDGPQASSPFSLGSGTPPGATVASTASADFAIARRDEATKP